MAIKQKSPINGRAPSLLPPISPDKKSSDPMVAVQIEASGKGQEQEQIVVPQLPSLRPRQKLHHHKMNQHQHEQMNQHSMNQHQNQHIHRHSDESSKSPHYYSKSVTSMFQTIRLPNNKKLPMDLVMAGMVWYFVGVLSIVTTKILLTKEDASSYAVPPLVLTLQQLVLGSTLLRIYLGVTKGVQPLPKDDRGSRNCNSNIASSPPPSMYYDLVLAGLFNALDFLASNTSFSHSAASFVETIKASEPITTTAIALFFGIDKLRFPEAVSLGVLVSGVLCSTFGNSNTADMDTTTTAADSMTGNHEDGVQQERTLFADNDPPNLVHESSIKTCMIVMTANVCFALRAKSQKIFRAQEEEEQQQASQEKGGKHQVSSSSPPPQKLNDTNLLMRMQQIGALSLILPVLIFESPGIVLRTLDASLEKHLWYIGLALLNATAFSSYCVASCYVLTKLSVMQYTGLGCLRRMFAILSTSLVFQVPITPISALGIGMCFCGFCSFTHYRNTLPPINLHHHTTTTSTSTSTSTLSTRNSSRSDDDLMMEPLENRSLNSDDSSSSLGRFRNDIP